ncbi:MAG TPA: IclR family transcriptional regulator [Pusillimonas sp.]|uniref:IclR family transcriptional regulator n=1 Tax=Pusillimonas sp. TaxID=3040095 RepID=UPI002C9CAE8B|nr:IclR family transcriptional regulator [Pusillimonas sp.]HUH88811.1 IclR family transcriptional regulator [Pusillimonas sp.]
MSEVLSMQASDKYIVPGLERGLRILGEFTRQDSVLSAPELARRLGIPRSTVFRLLSTLETLGFVERDAGGRDYSLGLAVLRLGFECLASKELTELGRPILDRLRESVGYSCNLVVRDGRSVVYVARSAVTSPFANTVYVGTRLPAHSTLFGRVLLRDLSYAQLHDLYPEEQLHQATDKTPATVDELFKVIQADKTSEYVFEPGYYEESIATLVVPVYGRGGAVISAIGVTVPSAHIQKLELQALAAAACRAAAELSQLLDHIAPGTDISATPNERKQ